MEETTDGITYRVQGGVATVMLDRPERLNALDLAAGRAYNQALRLADADPSVRAILVSGAGRAFCSGADLSAMEASPSGPEERLPADGLAPELPMYLRKPVVAAVHGPAIGVGLVLALYADVRVVAEDAVLGFGFTRLGLIAEYGTAWLLPHLIGASRARELLIGSRRFTGREAFELGLAHRAVAAADVPAVAGDYVADLVANCSPAAMAAAKAQLLQSSAGAASSALTDARTRMLAALDGPELAEGFAAQFERRAPRFAALPAGA